MVTCPECGRSNKEGAKFCIHCGAPLSLAPRSDANAGQNVPMPDWVLRLQRELPDELRDPELERLNRERAAAAPPVAPTGSTDIAAAEAAVSGGTDWLNRLLEPEGPATSEEPPSAPALEGELPSWLTDLRGSMPREQEPRAADVPEPDLPDWLRPAAPPREPVPEPSSADDVQPARQETPEPSQPPESASPEPEMPDWLRDVVSTGLAGPQSSPPDVQSWLFGATPGAEAPSPPVESETPDWLEEFRRGPEAPAHFAPPTQPPVEEHPPQPPAVTIEDRPVQPEDNAPTPSAAEPAAPIPSPPPAGPEQTVPDWLSEQSEDASASAQSTEPPAAEAGVPDWLAEFRKQRDSTAGPTAWEPPEKTPPAPEWLRSWQETNVASEGPDTEPERELPDWLRQHLYQPTDEPPTSPEEATPEETSPAAADQPTPEPDKESATNWLSRIMEDSRQRLDSEAEAELGAQPSPGSGAQEESMPDWLRSLQDQGMLHDAEPPEWLTRDTVPPAEEPAIEEEPPVSEPSSSWQVGKTMTGPLEVEAGEDVPDWLQELDGQVDTPAPIESPASAETAKEAQVPDWLKAMGSLPAIPTEPTITPKPTIAPKPTITPKPPALPTVSQPPAKPAPPVARVADPLAGVDLPLQAQAAVTTFRGRPGGDQPVADANAGNVQAFEEIVARPLLAQPEPHARKGRGALAWFGRLALYLLVIAAVAGPLYWQGPLERGFITEFNIGVPPAVQDAYALVDSAPSGSPILVVLDYDAALSEELNLQARAVLKHLIARRAPVLLASTTVSGPELGQQMMDELTLGISGYRYGSQYLNLGYLPGQEASLVLFGNDPLRTMRTDFRGTPDLDTYPLTAELHRIPEQGISSIVPLIVLFSGSQEGLRTWIEQIGTLYGAKILAGVTGGIAPFAQTYVNSRQLAGLLAGLPAAAEYEVRAGNPGMAVRGFDAQASVHLLLVVLIVAANIVRGIARVFRRR